MSDAGTGRRGLRRFLIAVLAGISCLLILLSTLVVWVHRTVISTDGFVSTVAPIVEDREVTEAMSVRLTDEIFQAVDIQRHVKDALPSAARAIAAPVANAAHGFVHDQVLKVLRSAQFHEVWKGVLRQTHRQVIAALRGDGKVLNATNGTVVLDVLPILDNAMKAVQSQASGLLGRDVTLPDITTAEVSPEQRARLSDALGVRLPSDFGDIEIARASSLDVGSSAVRLLDVLVWLLPLLTVLVLALTIGSSPNRRRTMMQIVIGTAVLLVIGRRLHSRLQTRIIDATKPASRAAAGGVIHQVSSGLVTVIWWLLAIAAVALLALLVSTSRRGRARDQRDFAWIRDHTRALQGGGAIVGAILLFVVPGWWFVVVAVVLVAFELTLAHVGRSRNEGDAPAPKPPSPIVPPTGQVGAAS